MTVGDLLEILAAGAASLGVLLVVAGLVSWIVAAGAALVVLCPLLIYLAQVWAGADLSSRRED